MGERMQILDKESPATHHPFSALDLDFQILAKAYSRS